MAIRVMAPGQDIHWLKCSTGCGCEAVQTVAPSQYVSGQYEQWLRVNTVSGFGAVQIVAPR